MEQGSLFQVVGSSLRLVTCCGGISLGPPTDISLEKPEEFGGFVKNFSLVKEWREHDLVLLKADFEQNKLMESLKGKSGFDFLDIDFEVIPEGTDVYSFGYPLPESEVVGNENLTVGLINFYPRATSAIVSSHHDVLGPVQIDVGFPRYYVIDKALNYGNSGGPIVVNETGRAFSVCIKFQPVDIPQRIGVVSVPSLYGVAVSLKNIEEDLRTLVGIH